MQNTHCILKYILQFYYNLSFLKLVISYELGIS